MLLWYSLAFSIIQQMLAVWALVPLPFLSPACTPGSPWLTYYRSQASAIHELPDVQAGFRKGRGTRDQIANIAGSWKKQESSRKTSTLALLIMSKPFTVWITTTYGKFFKRWKYQTTWPASWEICMQIKKQQLHLDMEQHTGPKSGKEYVKAVYCHPAYLTSMQSTSWEMLGWMKHKLESRLLGEISATPDIQMIPS